MLRSTDTLTFARKRHRLCFLAFAAGTLSLGIAGCGAFSSSFVSLFDPTGTSQGSTLDNPRGHVIVAFVNNAEVDERLLDYLESAEGGGLDLTEAEKRALRPRLRFRVRVTFADGQQAVIEFVDGSTQLVETNFNSQSEPDLNENDLNNFVAVCDVARVEVIEPVEVFVPVELTQFQFVEPTGTEQGFFRELGRTPPQFEALEVDDVDADLNTTLRRNVGLRDRPGPVDQPRCGAVVGIIVDGTLSVPFREDQGGVPGFDVADLPSAASVGGRYEFRVTVQ